MPRLRSALALALLAGIAAWLGSVACASQPSPILSGGGFNFAVTLRNVSPGNASIVGPAETMGPANVVPGNGPSNTRTYSFKAKTGDVLTFSANPGGQTVTVDCTVTGATPFASAPYLAEVILQPSNILNCSGW